MIDFSCQFIFKFKQYQNANIANFVYYGKTRMYILPPAKQTQLQVLRNPVRSFET